MVVLLGCGQSPCAHLARAEAQLPLQGRACTDLTFSSFDQQRCERNASLCTNDDFRAMDDAATCLEQLPACDPASEQAWAAQSQACAPQLSGGCAAAVLQ